MNRSKEVIAEQPVKSKKLKQNGTTRKYLRYLNVIGIFSNRNLVNSLPFIFFLTILALVYIANSYQAEKTIREIDSISKELKTLRTEYISESSELMFLSKQSEVAKAVINQGLEESVEAPMKIIINDPNSEKGN